MIDYSTLLVVDFKTTIWEKALDQPPGQSLEVIKIDIASVDTQKVQVTEQEEIFVAPKTSKISPYCEQVYGISQTMLDKRAVSFEEAYRRLRVHYMSPDRQWASWGNIGKHMLDRQTKVLGLDNVFIFSGFNIQHMFYMMTHAEQKCVDISSALEYAGLAENKNDAVNVANLFLRMARGLRPSIKSKFTSPLFHQAN